MKNGIDKLISNIFGILIFVSVGLGAVSFLMFIIALIIGGESGASLSLSAKKVIDFGIRMASLGVLFGLIKIYFSGKHYLTMKAKNSEVASDPGNSSRSGD